MSDALAKPPLTEVMAAAGRHDVAECVRLLDEAESHLGAGFHKARIDISSARGKARDRDFAAVWRLAWAATTGLTHAFPTDQGLCPPYPQATPFPVEAPVCGCGATLRHDSRFCHACGAPAA